jgi:hypothetical protein
MRLRVISTVPAKGKSFECTVQQLFTAEPTQLPYFGTPAFNAVVAGFRLEKVIQKFRQEIT